jgi:hypothetical protein
MARATQVVDSLKKLAGDANSAVQVSALEALQNMATDASNIKRLILDWKLLDIFVRSTEDEEV